MFVSNLFLIMQIYLGKTILLKLHPHAQNIAKTYPQLWLRLANSRVYHCAMHAQLTTILVQSAQALGPGPPHEFAHAI